MDKQTLKIRVISTFESILTDQIAKLPNENYGFRIEKGVANDNSFNTKITFYSHEVSKYV